MHQYSSDIAFTPTVKAIQTANGSREIYARMEQEGSWKTKVNSNLSAFLANADMFYLGTSNAEGQPYVQYRGGPQGFLKVIDDNTLGFADFGGNRQFITTGNLRENPKAFIFLIDYVNRQRMKLWGHAKVVENDDKLLKTLSEPEYPGRVERAILFEIDAWCGNCPQHIHQRFPKRDVAFTIEQLQARIAELEAELAAVSASR